MKKLSVGLLLLLLTTVASAQANKQQRRENIEAQKVAFLTSKMGLTPSESEKFWPLYNQCKNELKESRQLIKQEKFNQINIDQQSDKSIKEMIDLRFKAEEEKLRIEKKYNIEFQKVLNIRQVAKLYQAEEDFKKEVLKEIRRRKAR